MFFFNYANRPKSSPTFIQGATSRFPLRCHSKNIGTTRKINKIKFKMQICKNQAKTIEKTKISSTVPALPSLLDLILMRDPYSKLLISIQHPGCTILLLSLKTVSPPTNDNYNSDSECTVKLGNKEKCSILPICSLLIK